VINRRQGEQNSHNVNALISVLEMLSDWNSDVQSEASAPAVTKDEFADVMKPVVTETTDNGVA